MRHNTISGRQNNVSELTRWQKIHNPLLNFTVFNIESRADNTTLVQSSCQFNDNLVRPVIIDDFEFPNVSCSIRQRRNTMLDDEWLRECELTMLEMLSRETNKMSGPGSSCNSKRRARSQRSFVVPLELISSQSKELTMLLHAPKELDYDLGGRADQNLSPSALLSVGDCLKTIGEY